MIQIVGPNHALQRFGVKLVGVNAESGKKLLFSIVLIVFLSLLGRGLRSAAHRLTDNWLEMTVRFIVTDYGIRDIKSKISRDLLTELDRAGIGIASGTYEVVGMPPIKVQMVPDNGAGSALQEPAMDLHQ